MVDSSDMAIPSPTGGRFRLPSDLAVLFLFLYGGIWFVMVILQSWLPSGLVPFGRDLASVLMLTPPGSGASPGFQPWQLLTAHFIHEPRGVTRLLFGMLGVWFFVRPLQQMLGSTRVVGIWVAAAVGAVAGAVLFGLIQHSGAVQGGIEPCVLAVLVVFCERIPNAVIRLFFVIPIEARWLGRGTALLTALLAFAMPDVVGGWDVGGLAAGWAWYRYGGDPGAWLTRWRARRVVRRIAKFSVIDGGKGPTFH